MVYVAVIEDSHALVFDGPVVFDWKDPKLLTSSDLDDVKDSWELQSLPDKESEWSALQKNAISAIQRIELTFGSPDGEQRILDFGSGWGFFLAVAQERGWKAYGLEPLLASAVYARATFGLNIVTDTLRDHMFPPDFFDVVTCFQVFEHLPYPKQDLERLHNCLRQDGIILIEVPNFETWTMRIMRSRHRHFVQDHLNFFSGETLGRLLASNGFKAIDCYCPTRYVSVRYLVKHWAQRYMPSDVSNALRKALERRRLWQQTIGLNFGDIITVIARKRE